MNWTFEAELEALRLQREHVKDQLRFVNERLDRLEVWTMVLKEQITTLAGGMHVAMASFDVRQGAETEYPKGRPVGQPATPGGNLPPASPRAVSPKRASKGEKKQGGTKQ